jgi:serine protease AprX
MRDSRRISARFTSVLICALASAFAADNPKLSRELQQVAGNGTVDVIVQYRTGSESKHHARVKQNGGALNRELGLISGAAYKMSGAQVAELAKDPDVLYISPDRPLHGSLEYANPTVGANIARSYGFNGKGISIAVIDSGISVHADLKDSGQRVVYDESFVPGERQANDLYGHGTHLAGILAGNAALSSSAFARQSFRGIAPELTLLNLKVLDGDGNGSDGAVIEALDRAVKLKHRFNIRVVNLSLGRPVYESFTKDPLCMAVERVWREGIVVVVAAGNEGRNNALGTGGYGTISSPGNSPFVITVGAMNDKQTLTRADDVMATYSSKGPTLIDHVVKPDLVAPGNRIISLAVNGTVKKKSSAVNLVPLSYYTETSRTDYSYDYYRLSGTSMAAPMVSAAAALLLQRDPSLTPDAVKARLMKTATKTFAPQNTVCDPSIGQCFTVQNDIFTVGAGYLDVWAALNCTDALAGPALSPIARFDATTGKVSIVHAIIAEPSLIGAYSALWGSTALWGSSAIWGSSVFVDGATAIWGSLALWGSTAIWGSRTETGFSALWGSRTTGPVSVQAESLMTLIRGDVN